jgi:hypothetical protein
MKCGQHQNIMLLLGWGEGFLFCYLITTDNHIVKCFNLSNNM